MKWMIIVVVLNIAPVKTGLLYDDLATCWAARDIIAQEYADVANHSLQWAHENLTGEKLTATTELIASRLGSNPITCVPHADSPISN